VRALPRATRSALPAGAAPGDVDAAVRALVAEGRPLFAVDEALVEALAPDVLLTQAVCDVCAVSERDVCAVAERIGARNGARDGARDGASGVAPRVVTLGATTLDGVLADVERVAAALGVPDAGRALVEAARARLARVAERVAGAARPRCAIVEWTAPVFLAGHWGPEMVARAGGVDVLGVAGAHSVTVELARLAATDPEVVVIAPCGYALDAAAAEARSLLDRPEWGWLAGRAVWALDANAYLSRPGPRLVDGVELLAALLHPPATGAPPASAAVRIV